MRQPLIVLFAALLGAGHAMADVSIGAAVPSVTEGSAATISVVSTVPAPVGGTAVTLRSSPGTALAGTDYAAADVVVTILEGATSVDASFATQPDALDEADETFTVSVLSVSSAEPITAPNLVTITIVDDDAAPTVSLGVANAEVDEGDALGFTVTATLSAVSGLAVTLDVTLSGLTATAGVDFDATTIPVTIPAGTTSVDVDIVATDDARDETDELFTVTIANPVNATAGAPASVTLTILDDDAPPTIALSASQSVAENVGTVSFTATLSAVSDLDVTGVVQPLAGTAGAADFGAQQAFTILAGDTTASVAITIVNDVLDEADTEAFTLTLITLQNATRAGSDPVVTIADNDAAPEVSVTIADPSVPEGDGVVTVTVGLSAVSGRDVTVDIAPSAGAASATDDFDGSTVAVLIPAGTLSVTADVVIVDDVADEDDEDFRLTLQNPTNATLSNNDTLDITIVDDDNAPSLSIADASVNEAGGTVTLTVTLSAASGRAVRFDADSSNGTATAGSDFTTVNINNVNITPGQRTATINVSITNDAFDEDDETLTVTISGPNNALIADGTATVTIIDNDAPQTVSVDDAAAVTEGANASFTIRLSASSGRSVDVTAFTTPGSAAQADFSAVDEVVTFAPGTTTRTVTVGTINDALDEDDGETFALGLRSLVNATAGDLEGLGRINDNDNAPDVFIDNASVTEGNGGSNTITFPLRLSSASGRATSVQVSTVDGTARAGRDYTTRTDTVTFAAGVTSGNFVVTINADDVHEGLTAETFTATLSALTNLGTGDLTATGTISDDDGAPVISIADATLAIEGAVPTSLSFTVTVSRTSELDTRASFAASEDSPVSATANVDFFAQGGSVIVEPFALTATVVVPVFGDALDEADERFRVSLSAPQNGSLGRSVAIGTIVDDDVAPRFILGDVTVDENAGNAVLTLLLSERGGLNARVDFATVAGSAVAGVDFTAATGTATIVAGQQSTTITVPLLDDALDELDESFQVVLENGANGDIVDGDATVTVRDNDLAPVISIANVSVDEGDSGTQTAAFRVSLSAVSGRAVTATARSVLVPGGADAADFAGAVGVDEAIRFDPGVTERFINVSVVGDRLAEDAETFRVQLSGIDGASGGAAPATGTIVDDDSAPETVADAFSTAEETDLNVQANAGLLQNDSADDGDPLTVVVVTPPLAAQGALVLAADGGFSFAPAADFAGTVDVAVDVSDGVNVTRGQFTLTVNNVNDAPVIDPAVTVEVRVDEDVFDSPGAVVSDVLQDAVSDVDLASLKGMAIVGLDAVVGGAFEVSFDGGVTFSPITGVSEQSALLVASDDDTRLRLVPPPDQNPTVALRYVAWDLTDGASEGDRVDVSTGRGGASAFSTLVGDITFEVLPVNDAPVFVAPTPEGVVQAVEGQTLVLQLAAFDDDGPNQTFSLEGNTLPAAAVFDAAAGTVTWTPGFADAGSYTVTFVVDDDLLQARRTISVVARFIDADNDQVPDTVEVGIGTSTTSRDSDGDTILDSEELGADPQSPPDSDGDLIIDALDDDSDGDGVLDSVEAGDRNLDTPRPDTDGDGVVDALDTDSDNDTIDDGDDNCRTVDNGDQGDVDGDLIGDACDDDADGDRVMDRLEAGLGLDPNNPDSDGDSILDGEEVPDGIGPTSSRAWLLAILLAAVGTVGPARAQDVAGIGVGGFLPSPVGSHDLVVVEGTGVNGHLNPTVALVSDYGYSQLQVKDARTGAQVALLEHRLSADVVASISVLNRFAFWLGMPASFFQAAGVDDTFQPLALPPFALGDVRLGGRWSILSMRRGPGLALSTSVTAPTGDPAALNGAGGFTVRPQLNAGWRFGDAGRVLVNVGYLVRPAQELLGLRVGNEVTLGAGGEVPLFLTGLSGLLEVNGRVSADPGITSSLATTPLETQVGLRYAVWAGHTVTGGAALGITPGYGTPLLRAFVGYAWTPQGVDGDGDGVPDDVDRCPEIPEDEDFHEDGDGCPEEEPTDDSDGDGIADFAKQDGDLIDQCPELPEDKDGFEDDDGCPDTDHDGDGLDEDHDTCPNEPEDRDGFQDDDGCPDADNDSDGFMDAVDRCPNAAEVRNGFEDEDGCPDVPPAAATPPTTTPATTPTTPTTPTTTTTPETVPPMQGPVGSIILPQKIYFTIAGAELTPEGRRLVDQVAEAMKQSTNIRVEVQGHTDGQGDDRVNDHLALRRAETVVGYLVSKGVERPRLLITILGKSQPLAPNDSPRERALNRRVEFRVLNDAGDGPR